MCRRPLRLSHYALFSLHPLLHHRRHRRCRRHRRRHRRRRRRRRHHHHERRLCDCCFQIRRHQNDFFIFPHQPSISSDENYFSGFNLIRSWAFPPPGNSFCRCRLFLYDRSPLPQMWLPPKKIKWANLDWREMSHCCENTQQASSISLKSFSWYLFFARTWHLILRFFLSDSVASLIFINKISQLLCRGVIRWSLSGFEPASGYLGPWWWS